MPENFSTSICLGIRKDETLVFCLRACWFLVRVISSRTRASIKDAFFLLIHILGIEPLHVYWPLASLAAINRIYIFCARKQN